MIELKWQVVFVRLVTCVCANCFLFSLFLLKIINQGKAAKGKANNKLFIIKHLKIMLFTGRLTAKAELKAVKGDKQVINFTVAINQKWKNKAGEKKE